VDLRTRDGIALVNGAWRYSDARLVEVDARAAGPDLKASGARIRALDVEPKAGAAEYDDSSWAVIDPSSLEARRTSGRFALGWYRLDITLPARLGAVDTAGSTVVFEIVVDDYAEVWVDGRLPRMIGQSGGSVVGGFNAPNRVVLTHDARPGQRIRVAVLGVNAPLSDPPANFVWVRSATLDVYRPGAGGEIMSHGAVTRLDPALDAVLDPSARVERLAGGFLFTEGPVWLPEGALLFSDPNANTIYRWSPDDGVAIVRPKSGYAGIDIGEYRQPGSNGLALDAAGRVTVAEHGNRRISRIEPNGVVTVLADRFEGKRFNSPNDLVYRSDGALYFTDPPFGLPKFGEDPRKELPFSGVYRWRDGVVTLLTRELDGPNGLAFSPDERFLYVGNWDERRKVVMRYPVTDEGIGPGLVFADLTTAPGEDAIDGIKVDREGHVFVSGPGGVWIFSPDGRHLGTLTADEHPHNMAWGDADGRTLYMTAQTGIYRVRIATGGPRPVVSP
jgi:gluconolactonase